MEREQPRRADRSARRQETSWRAFVAHGGEKSCATGDGFKGGIGYGDFDRDVACACGAVFTRSGRATKFLMVVSQV